MTELRTFYPEIEPFETGMLDVGDGHTIHWERVGEPGILDRLIRATDRFAGKRR